MALTQPPLARCCFTFPSATKAQPPPMPVTPAPFGSTLMPATPDPRLLCATPCTPSGPFPPAQRREPPLSPHTPCPLVPVAVASKPMALPPLFSANTPARPLVGLMLWTYVE